MPTTRPATSGASITSRTARTDPTASSVAGTSVGSTIVAITATAGGASRGAAADFVARQTSSTPKITRTATAATTQKRKGGTDGRSEEETRMNRDRKSVEKGKRASISVD